MQVLKIVVGALVLFVGLSNISGAFEMRNAREGAGYMIPTLFFIILGSWLLYSGIRHDRNQGKVLDLSDDSE